MFSTRTPGDLAINPLAEAVARARAAGTPLIDLTASNPTLAGFDYPADLLSALADSRGLVYAPEPLGLMAARQAVAADYRRRGRTIAPERIVLTASTSDAYSLLFKVLCEPGDEVLVPRPGYPLFEHLTRLDAVAAVPYDLEYHGAWSVDLRSVEQALSPRTRILLLVHPNNPTGSFLSSAEGDALAGLCAARDIAVVADEVFAEYELTAGAATAAADFLARADALTFSLGGLSKSIGLPQAKLGWMVVSGPDATTARALSHLEVACDAYLSVSTPVQIAAADLLARGAGVRRQIQARVARNYETLHAHTPASGLCRTLRAEGGWYAVVQVPSIEAEDALVLGLLAEEHVLVHPGYFFDFAREAYVVVSLLAPEDRFREGVARLVANVERRAAGR